DISSIATNPFKQIAKYKSGAPNEWAKMNQNMHSKGLTQQIAKYKSGAPNEWARMNQNMHSKGLTQDVLKAMQLNASDDALKAMQLQQLKEDFQTRRSDDALKAMQLQQSKEDFKKELSLQLTLVENRKQVSLGSKRTQIVKMEKLEDASKIQKNVEKMEKLEDAYKIQKDVRQYKDSLEQSKREQVERFQRVREERENEMAQANPTP
ncbi:hypothetical protein T484DRAFT_1859468, partial [Baffinella frigidus]